LGHNEYEQAMQPKAMTARRGGIMRDAGKGRTCTRDAGRYQK